MMVLRTRAARQARECCNTKCQVARLITRCHPLLIQYIHVAVARSRVSHAYSPRRQWHRRPHRLHRPMRPQCRLWRLWRPGQGDTSP